MSQRHGQKLTGKVAVVTGASKGIGAGIAKELAAEGAAVVVNFASSPAGAEAVVREITGAGGRAVAVQANVAKRPDIERLFAETKRQFGRLDILVNNAGVFEFSPLENITDGHFHRQFDLNVLGLILTVQEAVRQFDSLSSIINISSVVSTRAMPGGAVYSATKAAVDAVTRSLSRELGPRRIRVNSINPGLVETEGTQSAGVAEGDFRRAFEAEAPLGRIGKPQDIANAALFLAANESAWITGESFYVSGGYR